MRSYFAAHAYGNATLADLLAALEQASGRDLGPWSKAWLETAGVNTLRPEFSVGGDGRFTSFAVLQEAPASHPVLRPHRIAIGLYDLKDGEGLVRRHRAEVDIAGDRTEMPELAGQQRPDLVLLNDDDLSYAKIRLDERSMRTMVGHIGDVHRLAARGAVLGGGLGHVPGRRAARPLLRHPGRRGRRVRRRRSRCCRPCCARRARRPAGTPTRPGGRTACGPWRPGCACLAEQAAPGSDRQLAFLQAFAGVAVTPGDLALLAGLLDGSATLDGLEVDTELRWRLLHRLVARGAAGPAEIDAELARDATDAGERRAATCRAAIGDPAAKEAAWAAITSGSLPNAVFRATLAGFADPDRPDLLAPYAARYFDVVGTVWASWGSDMAQWFASNAFPLTQISEHTLRLADEYLAQADPPAPLRRLIIEGKDSVQRALRCQERDRQAG